MQAMKNELIKWMMGGFIALGAFLLAMDATEHITYYTDITANIVGMKNKLPPKLPTFSLVAL
jgi:hypothetical protein